MLDAALETLGSKQVQPEDVVYDLKRDDSVDEEDNEVADDDNSEDYDDDDEEEDADVDDEAREQGRKRRNTM